MPLSNIFKRKPKKKVKEAKPEKKELKVEKAAVEAAPQKIKKGAKRKIGEVHRILKAPHITEKAADLAKKNQYSFKVFSETNKFRIKKAIEDLYGVDVVSVKVVVVPAKKRRLGRISGLRKGYKKAIVKIKEGQKIEIMPR